MDANGILGQICLNSAADGANAALSAEQDVNKRAKLRPQYS